MTDTRLITGGPRPQSLAVVSADQVTIVGNGTSEYPLRAAGGGDTTVFAAAFHGGRSSPRRGQCVVIASMSEVGASTTVQPGIASDEFSRSHIVGVVSEVNDDRTVEVKTAGRVVLTTEEWDAVTGGTGGLRLGATYFLAGPPGLGRLTLVPPSIPGVFVTRVGIGLSPRALLVAPAQPLRNLAGATFEADFAGHPPLVGIAANVLAPGVLRGASNRNEREAAAVGVVVVVDGTRVVVQTAGIVTLTAPQWGVVTKSARGLIPGEAYFVGREGGLMTHERPARNAIVAQIGVALSATELLLSAPGVAGVVARPRGRGRLTSWLRDRCWRRLTGWLRRRPAR